MSPKSMTQILNLRTLLVVTTASSAFAQSTPGQAAPSNNLPNPVVRAVTSNDEQISSSPSSIADSTDQLVYRSSQVGSVSRSIASKLSEHVSVMDFPGCDPSGRTDSTRCIQAAIDSVIKTRGLTPGGTEIEFPSGTFRTSAPINLTGRSGIRLVGAGRLATALLASGNYPLIEDIGTYTAVDNKIGVAHMWLQCAGMSGSRSHGIAFTYVNSASIKDIFITGCNHALDLHDNWQTEIDGVRIDGTGSQQNAIGLYAGSPTNPADAMPNNALVVANTTVQNVALYAFRLAYFAGSKFTNVEGANGVTAWYLCDAAYVQKSIACQFGHFSNILADSTSGPGITIQQGANTNPVTDVMLSNVWIGNSTTYGLLFNGATYSTARGIHIASADTGIYIKNSNYVTVDADIHDYNRSNIGSYAVVFDGSSNSVIHAATQTTNTVLGYDGIIEKTSGSGNQIWGGAAPCSLSIAFGGASSGVRYASRTCQYQVQGQHVSVQFSLDLSAVGTAIGAATLTGLPIASDPAAANGAINTLAGIRGMRLLTSPPIAHNIPGSTTASLLMQGPTGTSALTSDNFTSGSVLAGQLNYFKR